MKLIGICGRSGSGKTTVGEIICQRYSAYIDCDKVSKEITTAKSPLVSSLAETFGKDVLNEDGTLNRGKVASIAFSNKEETAKLNKITHKYILNEVFHRIKEYKEMGEKFVFLDAPTLFESGLDKKCDYIICVFSDEEKLKERIKARDNKNDDEINKRLSSQKELSFLRSKADFCIENNGTLIELYNKVNAVLDVIEEKI